MLIFIFYFLKNKIIERVIIQNTKSKKRTLCVSCLAADAGRFAYYRKNLNSILKYQKIGATIVLVLNLQAATIKSSQKRRNVLRLR